MGRVFLNVKNSSYLGENRSLLDTVVAFVPDSGPTPTPSATSVTPTPTPAVSPTQTPTNTTTPTTTPTPTPTVVPIQTEYALILDRANQFGFDPPCLDEQYKQNNLIIDLKNAGLWNKLGMFHMFKVDSTCASPGFTLINWIVPSNPIASLVRDIGGTFPTLTSTAGWRFNQTNRLQLGLNIGAMLGPILLSSTGNTEGVYYNSFIGNSTSGTNNIWGSNNNGWNAGRYNNTTNHIIFRNNGLTTTYDFTGLGFKSASIDGRPDTDTTIIFNNNGVQSTRTKVATDVGIAGNGFFMNGAESSSQHSWICGMFFAGGGGFTSADAVSLETIITSYMTS